MTPEETKVFHTTSSGEEDSILGTAWNSKTDTISLKVRSDLLKLSTTDHQRMEEIKLTKRMLLRNVAKIYDPIGLAAALTIRAKIGMQELWRIGFDWDDELPLVAAKSQVAPLKQLTLPRLELQAAVLASRLAKTIREESRIHFKSVHFFTDSTITLAWITRPSRFFKPFVSARVGEIQSNSEPSQWRHIPGDVNVADDLSRGISAQDLTGRWRDGPKFLRLPEELWPQLDTAQAPPVEHMERRRAEAVCQVKIAENPINHQVFSSWRRLIRVTAHIRRLAEKIRLRRHTQEGKQGPLTPEELLQAELFWIRDAQKGLHDRLAKGEFKTLSPFIDDKGIIRVGGRLDKAIVSYETKHPALLPTANWISLLITRHMHQFGHPGVAATTAKIRQQYWILKANKLSKSVKTRCVKRRLRSN